MQRCIILLALATILAGGHSVRAQSWARKMFPTASHDFGTMARGSNAEFTFELNNIYREDVHITDVYSTCGCVQPKVAKRWLQTGEQGQIVCQFNTRSFTGFKNATVVVKFDKPFPSEVHLDVSGNVRGDVVFKPGAVQFNTVDQGNSAQTSVQVDYAGRLDWRITDIRSGSNQLAAELIETRRSAGRVTYTLLVRLMDTAPAGNLHELLTIVTNDPRSSNILLLVEGRVSAPLTVSPASLSLGTVKPGQHVSRRLVVRARTPFEIVRVTCDDDCFSFQLPEGSKTLHLIPVTFTAADRSGKTVETIQIETNLGKGSRAECVVTATVQDEGND